MGEFGASRAKSDATGLDGGEGTATSTHQDSSWRRVGVGAHGLIQVSALKPDLRDSAGGARVSLTMIVRDEEKNLPCCLESVRGVFDEIVVLDTGSKDRTHRDCSLVWARVFDFVWVDDFAAARMRRWHVPRATMRFGSMPMI